MSKAQWIAEHLKPGEEYAGILIGKNGDPDQHVILLPGDLDDAPLEQQIKAGKAIGGELPTRREQSLLFANLKEHFEGDWYWSSERHASESGYAWYQIFNHGYQYCNPTNLKLRARFVRRLPL